MVAACSATLDNGLITLSTGAVERRLAWSDAGPRTVGWRDLADGGGTWTGSPSQADLHLPGVSEPASDLVFGTRERPADPLWPARLEVTLTWRHGELAVRRVYLLVPGCPAIRAELHLRGRAAGPWLSSRAGTAADHGNVEAPGRLATRDFVAPVTERLSLAGRHARVTAVQFFDVTDLRNNLVRAVSVLPYRQPELLAGNLLLAWEPLSGDGFFLIKEAPCSDVQCAWPGGDFAVWQQQVQVLGTGLQPADLDAEEWRPAYAVTLGLARGGETGVLRALRQTQQTLRPHQPERDEMILVNTWGDRSQDRRIGEPFALAELEACARLGVTHFQLDDGWQRGRTTNSATPGGTLEDLWSHPGFWEPHPERFPRGLGPVVARARELGIRLALWYAPSPSHSYATWELDAGRLLELWREHDIRTFKIDMVRLPDALADRRYQALLQRVRQASAGAVSFNLDGTASRRLGYHYGTHYGNIFLENRYTDWSNYHPHWTLRNLWQLSRFVPSRLFQIEFLNLWRNPDKYPAHDPLAPRQVGFDYAFAVTLAAQPLAWFEATGLPAEAFALAPTIRAYRDLMADFHALPIFPIGEEPDGAAWTGFQALGEGHGWLLVYRECNQRPSARLALLDPALRGRRLHLTARLGAGGDGSAVVDAEDGTLRLTLPRPLSYALYQYRVAN